MDKISDDAKKFLEEGRVLRIATIDNNGSPRLAPFCYWIQDDKVYILTRPETKTVRNLRKNPEAAIMIDYYDEDWSQLKFCMIKGKTALIEDKEKVLKLHSIRGKKYSQQGDPTGRVFTVIRLEPSKIVTLRL
ncbi:MAG: pyridoxamine 5'-phosphate oxidase family protein [Candidatus Hodarchaeales archaeon]|jgi:nitroimidazol reductase NimA-like FMN-containing flavoprotein (pyridoxamine 5'-phosphate oxidase superfamily)